MNEQEIVKQNAYLRSELNRLTKSYNQLVAENEYLTKENERLEKRVTEIGWSISPDRQGGGW